MTLTIIAIVAADMVCVLLVLLLFWKGDPNLENHPYSRHLYKP